jgi:predicted ribosome quality control (RQC) complex YloA/Tae2 family protein
MLLRKHLSGKRIEGVSQHGFDRILEISAGGLNLILEFVPPGNVILTDPEGTILSALRTKRWRDREIRIRAKYSYPPERPDPFSMDSEKFRKFFLSDNKAVVVLASELGLGSGYANRLCSISGVRPDKPARSLDEKEIRSLFRKMGSLEKMPMEPYQMELERNDGRLERIEAQRAEAKEKWKSAEKLSKEKADAIYRKFDTVEAILERLSSRKEAGFEPVAKREGLHITVKLDGVDVQLDLKKSAQENAAFYYEQSKKARRKVASLESLGRPAEIKSREEPVEYPDAERRTWLEGAEAPSLHQWYKKFKWFYSSDGVLVVAGKNADQNELLLKAHALPDEWCFHADVKGAAFTVIKSGTGKPSGHAKKEAAEFAAANSKAWTRGMGSVHVFSVQRKSLSKTPPTGMHLEKGSFMVYGQRVWYRNVPLRMAVTAGPDGAVFSGPESSIKKGYSVILVPGTKKASDLSREIKSELLKIAKPRDLPLLQKLSLEELARHVPFGLGDIARK